MEPKGYNTGDEFNLPIVKPSHSNLEFDGWYDNDSYTGVKITKVNSFDTGNKKFFARTTLKEKEEYTIKYYINSNEVIFDLSSYYQGDTTILPIPELSDNQTFDGWYLNDEKITNSTTFTEDTTLYAKFIINKYSYKFLVDGEVYKEGTAEYGSEISFPSNPIKKGDQENEETWLVGLCIQ